MPVNIRINSEGRIEQALVDGSATNLGVDGSGTPKVYKFEPDANNDVELSSLALFFEDGDCQFGPKFMNLSPLSSGVLVQVKADDVSVDVAVIKRTRDLAIFGNGSFSFQVSGKAFVAAVHEFPGGLILRKSGTFGTNDFVKVTIQDDLSDLDEPWGEAHIVGAKI